MAYKNKLKDLRSRLYGATGEDWSLTVSMSLTEPTCPCAVITPDDAQMAGLTRFAAFADTMEEAIARVCDAIHAEVIDGKADAAPGLPYTNRADKEFPEWLKRKREELAQWRAEHP